MSELLPVPTGPQTSRSAREGVSSGQALNNLLVVRAWACAHPSMSGEPVAGISSGDVSSATSSAKRVDVGEQADAPGRRVGGVEREQLERGREHGLHVVVGDDARQARGRTGRSPRRSRRARAAAAAERRWPRPATARGQVRRARRSRPRPRVRDVARMASLGVRAAHAVSTGSSGSASPGAVPGHDGGGRLGAGHRGQPGPAVRREVGGVQAVGQTGLEPSGLGVAGRGQPGVGQEQREGRPRRPQNSE